MRAATKARMMRESDLRYTFESGNSVVAAQKSDMYLLPASMATPTLC